MKDLGLPFAPTGFPVEFLSLGGIGPGVPMRATVSDFGPQLLAKVLGANETQESSLGLVFHYADTKGLPLLDLVRPARAADVPGLQGRQGRARGHRRALEGDRRRAAALARRPGDRRRDGVLRRAAARHRRPAAGRRRTAAASSPASSCRPSQDKPGAVLDGDDVAGRRAVRAAAGGGRPRQAQARLLPRRGAPAVRRRDRRVRGVGDAHRAADPLQGRRRVLRHPGADRPPRVRARPARQPRPARAARVHAQGREGPEGGRLDLPDVGLLRRRRAADLDGHRRGGGHAAQREGRADAGRAHADGRARLEDGAGGRRRRRGEGLAAVREVRRRGWTRRARASCSRRGSRPRARRRPTPEADKPLEHIPAPKLPKQRRAPAPEPGGVGDFLNSRQGKAIQREVIRGVFGMLRKRL